jgi:pentatricopeptide repeat protein
LSLSITHPPIHYTPKHTHTHQKAISACEKGLNPSKALEIFDEMKREGVRPTVVTFSALISACEKGQQWKLALQVLEEMKSTFGPNVIAYSAAISALSKGQQWEKAWELFCEIEQSGEKLSVVTYNATMTALEKGLQWERALDLFDEMKYKNMAVTVVSYGSAISACEKTGATHQCSVSGAERSISAICHTMQESVFPAFVVDSMQTMRAGSRTAAPCFRYSSGSSTSISTIVTLCAANAVCNRYRYLEGD